MKKLFFFVLRWLHGYRPIGNVEISTKSAIFQDGYKFIKMVTNDKLGYKMV